MRKRRAPEATVHLGAVKSGDRGDSLEYRLDGVQDLTTVTSVELHLWFPRTDVEVTLAGTVVDAAARIVNVPTGLADNEWLPAGPACGRWLAETEVHFGDGSELTWPEKGYAGIDVDPSIA